MEVKFAAGSTFQSSEVESKFIDPVEGPFYEHECVPVRESEAHLDFVAVHLTIEQQPIPRGTVEAEAGLPVLVVTLGERNGFRCDIDDATVAERLGPGSADERIIHPLDIHGGGAVEYDSPPTLVIRQQRRMVKI